MPGGKKVTQTTVNIQKAEDRNDGEDVKPQTPADAQAIAQSPADAPAVDAGPSPAAISNGLSPRSRRWADRKAKLASMKPQGIVSYKNDDRCVLALRDEANSMRVRER